MNTLVLAGIAIVLLIGFALTVAVVSGRRMMREQGPLRLYRVAEAKGLQMPGATSVTEVREAAYAARRCAGCMSQARCDTMLESRDFDGLRFICPNTPFLDRLVR